MNSSTAGFLLGFSLICSTVCEGAEPLGNLVMNGAFEAGNQYWKGDGKVVTLPDGSKVYQLEATANRARTLSQEFRMHGLKKVEIVFRARSANYKGPGLRIAVHRPGAGSILYDQEPPNGNAWTDYRIVYIPTSPEDQNTLVISLHEGSGMVQFDDIEVREPGKLAKSDPPKPAVPAKPEAAKPAVAPAAAVHPPTTVASKEAPPVSRPLPAGTIVSLKDVLDSVPQAMLVKFRDPATQEEAAKEMNDYFAKNIKGRQALIKVTADRGEDFAGATTKYYRLQMPENALESNQTGIKLQTFFAYIPKKNMASESAVVAAGTVVTVSGDFTRCDIKNAGEWRLYVNLTGGRIGP